VRGAGGLTDDEREYYSDGAWYDAEYVHIGGDIPYYASVAVNVGSPVLELACGTGRLTIPMAQAGAEAVGIDVAAGMIEHANDKRDMLPQADQDRLEFLIGDMRSVRLDRRFDGVIIAFNTLMHMTTDDDLEQCLETARAHLTPKGRLYMDVHTPHPAVVPRQDPAGRYDPQEMIDPHSGDRYVVTENNSYDERHQLNYMQFFYQKVDRDGNDIGAERKLTLTLRVIFPRELDRWLHAGGFEIEEEWDDFDKVDQFSGSGGRRVLVARLRS